MAALAAGVALAAAGPVPAGRAAEVRTRAFELLNEGVRAYNEGDARTAVEKLSESASIALNSFRAHYYLGLALSADRRYGEAVSALEVALDLDPSHLPSLVALGDAHLKLGDPEQSRVAYMRALKLRPAFAPALDGLARSDESQARYEPAIGRYREAILADRGYAPAYTHLGELLLRQGRLEEAVRLLEEAVRIRPDYAPGMNRLALAYGRLGLDGEALATILEAIDLEPKDAGHRVTLGRLQMDRGSLSAAENTLARALELDPDSAEAREALAELARTRGQYDRALDEIDRALADPRAEASLVRKLEALRESVTAERDRATALEARLAAGEASPEDLSALAAVYAGRDLWDRAAELEARVPASAHQRELLAYLTLRAGRYREAERLYAELAADGRIEHRINRAIALARLGDDEEAIDVYRRVLEDRPGEAGAGLYLANALLRSGREQEAAAAYKRYLDLGTAGPEAERVRRILRQVAPELLPPPPPSPVPDSPPPPPPPPADAESP